jgi:hypothetical protein
MEGDEPVAGQDRSSKPVRVLTIVGLVFVAAVVGLVIFEIVNGVRKAVPAVQKDWSYIRDIRAGDAARVAAEEKAGKEYVKFLDCSLSAVPSAAGGQGQKVRLYGTIANKGTKDVLAVTATVVFISAEAGAPPDTHEVPLFDASENSVMQGSARLVGGESRTLEVFVADVRPTWAAGKIDCRLSRVLVDVGEAPPPPE